MKTDKSTEILASQILYHKKLYYQGKSIITNEEYDALEEQLKSLNPDHPVLSFVGYELSQKEKVHHQIPMLSLAKTYSAEELFQFLNKYECVAIDKFDGMALSLEYDDKGHLIRASTRGNGQYGENVTEQVFHIVEIPKSLHLTNTLKGHKIEIRGEVYFPISQFEKYSDLFDSFRNAVPGTLNRKDVNEASEILKTFLFCPFDILIYDNQMHPLSAEQTAQLCRISPYYTEKFKYIQKLGFHLHENFVFKLNQNDLTLENLNEILETLYSKNRDHQIDGLVFRMENEIEWESLGNTAHHPRGTLAFKRAGETAITEIIDIEPNVGRTGKISFRAKLNPVFLSNAKISHATLHNAEFIEKGHYSIGAKVKIIRSGEVIPAILERVDQKFDTYPLPTQCLCESPLIRQGPDLWCSQKGSCEYSNQESLVHFVSKTNMLGVSEKIVYKLKAAGLIQEPADFYKITVDDLLELEGFKEKSAQNVINAIHSRATMSLGQFLTALGLKGGGEVKSKEIAKKYKTLENIFNLTEDELAQQKGWAQKSAHDFIGSLHAKDKIIQNLLKYVTLTTPQLSSNTILQSHFLNGKNVCITGALSKPRSEIKKLLEGYGAKVSSSVNKATDILICNEASSSTKYKEALKLNIPIMTEEELLKTL